jgi:hypothetical protein
VDMEVANGGEPDVGGRFRIGHWQPACARSHFAVIGLFPQRL